MATDVPTEADLVSQLVLLHPDGSVRVVDAGDFWASAAVGEDPMIHDHEILLSVFSYDRDWPSAEVHPLGDEPVLVLEGALTMLVDVDREEQAAHAEAGSWCVVPAGVWHRALVRHRTRALHLTPGRGTMNRPAPDTTPEEPSPASVLVAEAHEEVSLTDGVAATGPGGGQWHTALGGSAPHGSSDVVLVDLDTGTATVVPAGGLPGLDEPVGPRTLVLAYGARDAAA